MNLTKNEINRIFEGFNQLNALIIGDVMIDAYYWGSVNRVSPEAPVPVVEVERNEKRLGGAANVALNVQALGANPILCSVVGNDANADTFIALLEKNNLSTEGIIKSDLRTTTVKTRVIGNNHQLLRVDDEKTNNLSEIDEEKLYYNIKTIVNTNNINVIIFEDYDKGIVTESLISKVVELATKNNIPTTVDPKKKNFLSYKGVTLFKPNLKEIREGLNISINPSQIESINKAHNDLHAKLNNTYTLITLSEHGVYIADNELSVLIPAHLRDIADVSGAGDTVISVASLCLALGENARLIAELSNLAGGLVCEKAGVVAIDKDQFYDEAIYKLI